MRKLFEFERDSKSDYCLSVLYIFILLFSTSAEAQNLVAFENENHYWGYRDSEENILIIPQYDFAFPFVDGYGIVKRESLWGVVNADNTIVIPIIYKDIDQLSEGLFLVSSGDGTDIPFIKSGGDRYGFVDVHHHFIIPPNYEQALSFSEGLAAVQLNGKFGFINHFDEEVIAFEYDGAQPFCQGWAAVMKKDKWGIIDAGGDVVLPFVYDEVSFELSDYGRIKLVKNRKESFIDLRGNTLKTFSK